MNSRDRPDKGSARSSAAKIFGERVRAKRDALGVSQETLGELAGLHWTFVGQVERGQRNVTLHNLVKIAEGLGVDPGELVHGLRSAHLPTPTPTETPADAIRRSRAVET